MPTPSPRTSGDFVAQLTATGVTADVAHELERRIHLIETEEHDDPSRARLSTADLVVYLAVGALATGLGLAVTLL